MRQWFATFVENGGLSATDVVCVHPYLPNDSTAFPSSVIPEWISHPTQGILSQIRGKPLVFTEMGAIAGLCISLYGSETDANMASLFLNYVQGCDGYPCALYDGVYGEAPPLDPGQDLTYWVNEGWLDGAHVGLTPVGSLVNPDMPDR